MRLIYEPYAISTVAGWGDNTHTVDGSRHAAEFNNPDGVAVARSGRVFIAVRDNARAAAAYGVNSARTRLAAFAISGFFASDRS